MGLKSIAALLVITVAWVAQAGPGELTFCRFGPKIKILEPRKPDFTKGVCDGEVKVQGVLWECVPSTKVESTVTKFHTQLTREAVVECKKFCARLAPGCEGKFDQAEKRWLLTTREDAVVMGQEFGCRSSCSGQAFAYSSIYNVGYLTDDVAFIAKQPVNCKCFKPRPAP
jgi:hypothetical protein